MKVSSTAMAVLAMVLATATFSQGQCLTGSFTFEFDGACTAASVLQAYEDQVYGMAGSVPATCTTSAEDDLNAKLSAAGLTLDSLCDQVYLSQEKVPFTNAANRGTDLHFESQFFNGRTDWQEEVETIYEKEDRTATSVLRDDAEAVRTFYRGTAQGRRVEWPGAINNFHSSVTDSDDLATCTTNAAMCCWPKDRQANDGNGNCATPYDENCVNKDPADNTNLCFVDLERGNQSTGEEGDGFLGYPEDNSLGEGAIHCHGFAWSNDVNHHTARYKANNLFFVSMYDHMYQRGYVKNIPGAPMCGCVEQMPTVTRSDCTQVDLDETTKITYDAKTGAFDSRLTAVDVDFNACQGINNRNNDLWAYLGRLYYDGEITPQQYGEAGRIITNHDCVEAKRYHLNTIGYTRGYDHNVDEWTKVAGRDDMFDGHNFGLTAFTEVFFGNHRRDDTSIMLRICPQCTDTHKKIYYRRKTEVDLSKLPDSLLNNILYHRNDGNGENRWNEDFSLHSTYEDAVTGDNPWKCPNDHFDYREPFNGQCSPDGSPVRNQYSIWNWYPGPQPDVAYYVNTPEGAGIDELDLATSLRFSNLYTSTSIGKPAIEGRVFERTSDDALIVSGGGWDIWGSSDAGHYLSEPWSGDIDVRVHVAEFNDIVNTWAKAGIMLRADGSGNANYVYAYLSGNSGSALTQRRSKGNTSNQVGQYKRENQIQKSEWIRLVKKMETVELYFSEDGINWEFYVSTRHLFPDDTYRVGLAVTSHDDRYVSEAVFTDFSIEEYAFPTSAPSLSSAPTAWDPLIGIGDPREGSYTYDANADLSNYYAYGTGIGGTSDSFLYHNWQKPLSDGAFYVEAYTNRFHTGYEEAKGGIMIRDTNDPDAAHAFVGMSGRYYNGVTFRTRAAAGGPSAHHQTTYVQHHQAWIRLSKPADSNFVTASFRINEGDAWTQLGDPVEIAFTGVSVLVGVAVASGERDGYVHLQTKGFEAVDASPRVLRA